jgi:hypothetical protein
MADDGSTLVPADTGANGAQVTDEFDPSGRGATCARATAGSTSIALNSSSTNLTFMNESYPLLSINGQEADRLRIEPGPRHCTMEKIGGWSFVTKVVALRRYQ